MHSQFKAYIIDYGKVRFACMCSTFGTLVPHRTFQEDPGCGSFTNPQIADSETRVGPGVKIGGEKSGTTMQNSQFLISMEISTPPLPHLLLPPPFSCSGEHQVKILL
ncbi:hypothetical protein AMECASPLE_015844 [Ameca splendens]|uniref:Uncharacterized protein n=1 Tax=Ameca splendens TaxID=208324 RepID=A0ABV0YNY6_9TELE